MASSRTFWPQGRERWIVLALLTAIFGIGGYTIQAAMKQLEAGFGTRGVSASSARVIPAFNTRTASIPVEEIHHGGPPKDGIPALSDPRFVSGDASTLNPQDRVITVTIDDITRAYPLRILQLHEIVNDIIAETAFAVVYCPLCDSATVFNREVEGEVLEFGVSGLLYQSNVLMYNRQQNASDESLWSQMKGEAVTGPRTGQTLTPLPHQLICWETCTDRYPEATVLSTRTGFPRNYDRQVYGAYFTNPGLAFPVNAINPLFHPKEKVLGIVAHGETKAYPVSALPSDSLIEDTVGGEPVRFRVQGGGNAVVLESGNAQAVHALWFAWYTFHPETSVYDGPGFDLAAWKALRSEKPQRELLAETAGYSERHQSNCALSPSSSDTEGE